MNVSTAKVTVYNNLNFYLSKATIVAWLKALHIFKNGWIDRKRHFNYKVWSLKIFH